MSAVVFKYRVPEQDRFSLMLPECALLLHFEEQAGVLMVWALVDPAARMVERHFALLGTGAQVPEETHQLLHVGTTQVGRLVLHLFEVLS